MMMPVTLRLHVSFDFTDQQNESQQQHDDAGRPATLKGQSSLDAEAGKDVNRFEESPKPLRDLIVRKLTG